MENSRRGVILASLAATFIFWGIAMDSMSSPENQRKIFIFLNPETPAESYGILSEKGQPDLKFKVGFGKNGIAKEGSEFSGGYSLLGKFRVNAKLSKTSFEMEPKLIEESGKSAEFLKATLFKNMSSIDFDEDAEGGEYGAAFIGLEPLSETEQPFHFGEYKGVFRWYSYAIHGTQDESRIGKMVTGGCINVGAEALADLYKRVKIGDPVEIRSMKN